LRKQAEDQEVLSAIKAENDNGNTEYKLKFDNPTLDRVDHLTGQMIFRLNEGFGHAVYKIGVMDSGEVYGITLGEVQ
jgi:GTPase